MKTIGIIGGLSWQSTQVYYQQLNLAIQHKLGGLHSAKVIIFSVDFHHIEQLQQQGKWREAGDILSSAAVSLQLAGADFILIASNTMHKVAPQVIENISIPFLHIADATGNALKASNINHVGLLGTRFTMEKDFYKGYLAEHFAINVLTPSLAQQTIVHDIIYSELCLGEITQPSKQEYQTIITDLANRGAQAIILGCTEIGLLIKSEDSSVALFDTTQIHIQAAIQLALED